MFSLTMSTLSPISPAISSSAGAIILQGPHHSAQKSTSTGFDAPSTSVAKSWSVTLRVAIVESPWLGLVAIWGFSRPGSTVQSDELRAGRIEQRRLDRPAGENHPQRLSVSRHLGDM